MKEKFNQNSIILVILTTAASGINYLCQILVGRFFFVEFFGIINAIFSFILLFGVLGNSLNQLIAKDAIRNQTQPSRICAGITYCFLIVGIFTLVFSIITLFAHHIVGQILGVSSLWIIQLVVLVVCSGCLPVILMGALSGMQKFAQVGLVTLCVPLFKLLGVLLAKLANQHHETIILLSMILGALAAVFLSGVFLHRQGISLLKKIKREDFVSLGLGKESVLILLINLFVVFFTNADVLFVNTFLGSGTSGIYSSAMLFGRIVYFAVTAIMAVMLPMVVAESNRQGNPFLFLRKSMIYTAILSFLCFVPINVFPAFLLRIIYGDSFLPAVPYVPYACAIALLLSFTNIVSHFLIGVGRYKFLLVSFACGAVVVAVLSILIHRTAFHLLWIIIITLAIVFFVNFGVCLQYRKVVAA